MKTICFSFVPNNMWEAMEGKGGVSVSNIEKVLHYKISSSLFKVLLRKSING
jgi:hypothetical protein